MEDITTMMESLSDDGFCSPADKEAFEGDKSPQRLIASKLLNAIKPRRFKLSFNSTNGNLLARDLLGDRAEDLCLIEAQVVSLNDYSALEAESLSVQQVCSRFVSGELESLNESEKSSLNICSQGAYSVGEEVDLVALNSVFFEEKGTGLLVMLRLVFRGKVVGANGVSPTAEAIINTMNLQFKAFRMSPRIG